MSEEKADRQILNAAKKKTAVKPSQRKAAGVKKKAGAKPSQRKAAGVKKKAGAKPSKRKFPGAKKKAAKKRGGVGDTTRKRSSS